MSRDLLSLAVTVPLPQPDEWRGQLGWHKLMRLYFVACDAAADPELMLFCSQDLLQRRTGFTWKWEIQQGLQDLQRLGLLVKVGKQQRADKYRVCGLHVEMLRSEGRASSPDDARSEGRASSPDDGRLDGRDDGREVGREVGREISPRTELNDEQEQHRCDALLARCIENELRIIPTQVPLDKLLHKKRAAWLPVIRRALNTYPHADDADIVRVVLAEMHKSDPRFELSESTRITLRSSNREHTPDAEPPASREHIASVMRQLPERMRPPHHRRTATK